MSHQCQLVSNLPMATSLEVTFAAYLAILLGEWASLLLVAPQCKEETLSAPGHNITKAEP